jgi:acyl-CoA synthetase (AMP-forming)/AMP-acid ligase II
MSFAPADRRRPATLEVLAHGRRIAGGLAAFGLMKGDVVALLLRHDPVYLSIAHACRIGGCRMLQLSPHSTYEQVVSALAEPGIKVLFAHEEFLPALSALNEDIELIAVTPLSLFPGMAPAVPAARRFHAYHQWLPLQAERKLPLPARRGRPVAAGNAISSDAYGACLRMLTALTRAADDATGSPTQD